MKRIIISLLLISSMVGCQKASEQPHAEFSFLLDGSPYVVNGDGAFPITGSLIQSTNRLFVAGKEGFQFSGTSDNFDIYTTIETPNLVQQVYEVNFGCMVGNKWYNPVDNPGHPGNGTIIFTRIEKDRASGVFSAIIDSTDDINHLPTGRKLIISNGKFSNVKISY